MNAEQPLTLIQQHLVKYLGPPTNVVNVSGSPIPDSPISSLNIAYFAPQGDQAPVAFATSGIYQFQMQDGRRLEALMLLRGAPDPTGIEAIQRLMAQFALFIQSSAPVQPGDVVGAEEELAHFSDMDTVLFLPPIPFVPEFHRAQIAENDWVDLIWLVPVFTHEAEYGVQHGSQALMMLFAAQNLDLTDPRRNKANTAMSPEQAEQALKTAQQDLQNLPPPKTDRASDKNPKQTSLQVDEKAKEVVVNRRGAEKKAHPSSFSMTALPGPRSSKPPAANRSGRVGGRVEAPKIKQSVRFDLKASGGKVQQKRPSAELPSVRKPEPEPKLTPEQKAEARKKRVEELKAIAKEVAERAKARQAQSQAPAEPVTRQRPSAHESTPVRAANRRRGAPKRPLKTKS